MIYPGIGDKIPHRDPLSIYICDGRMRSTFGGECNCWSQCYVMHVTCSAPLSWCCVYRCIQKAGKSGINTVVRGSHVTISVSVPRNDVVYWICVIPMKACRTVIKGGINGPTDG